MNDEQKTARPSDDADFQLSPEMGSARGALPPLVPILAALAIAIVVVTIFVYLASKPKMTGQVLGVYAAEQGDKSQVLVVVQLTVQDLDKKPMWIKDIRVQVKPDGDPADKDPLQDHFAAAVDFERYLQAFPVLAAHRMEPLHSDTKIAPGESARGMVIVAFPLSAEVFAKRQWLHVIVEPVDHMPITIPER